MSDDREADNSKLVDVDARIAFATDIPDSTEHDIRPRREEGITSRGRCSQTGEEGDEAADVALPDTRIREVV